jgi:hypothetical protein
VPSLPTTVVQTGTLHKLAGRGSRLGCAVLVAQHFDPILVFVVQNFTWNAVDLDVCVKCHFYFLLTFI